MESGKIITIEGLKKHFSMGSGKFTALNGIDLSFDKGEFTGVIGPSGSGKTTLVKAIIGTARFQAGTISVFGMQVPSFAAMASIGYMAQNDALYDDLTAMDHLLFFGRLYGLHGAKTTKRAEELLQFVDLEQDAKKPVRYFSGGMKRRLSLAIALINRPRLLILDEPTVGIDPVLRRKFWQEFVDLRNEGCTIVATTHVMDEAAHCDRILLLRQGQLIANDTLPQLLKDTGTATIEDAFLRFSGVPEEGGKA